MKSNLLKKTNGFTIIELMTVVVIIGIIIAISIPNFFTAQERAKTAEVKTNMHVYQIMIETYSTDWSGNYPATSSTLQDEAKIKNYWRNLKNPFTQIADNGLANITSVSEAGLITPSSFPKGNIGYIHEPLINAYSIYGGDAKNGVAIMTGNKVFTLTNH